MKLIVRKLNTAASFLSLLFILSISGPDMARGGGCPALTSAMVDAAWLAFEYSQPEPPVGGAIDDPSEPIIGCQLTSEVGEQVTVSVGDGEALLFGHGQNSPTPTYLRTRVFNLTRSEQHACRAQVLTSFVWSQYCKPVRTGRDSRPGRN